jgi:DNA-binding transcriptional regulator YiaG
LVGHEPIVSERPGLAKAKPLYSQGVQFSERVRGLMSELGLSIDDAAEAWGYSRNTIKNWRAGTSEPRWSEWEAIELAALAKTGTR